MKKFLTLLLALLFLIPFDGISSSPSTQPTNPTPPKKAIPISRPIGKIQTRDRHDCTDVTAYLLEDVIYINFEEPEGMATVIQIENGMTTLSRNFASTLSEIKVPLAASDCSIQLVIKTTEGNEYEGWIMPDE